MCVHYNRIREYSQLLLRHDDIGNDNGLEWPVGISGRDILDRIHDLHAGNDAAEDGVLGVEEIIGGGVDEKLAAVGIGPRIRHSDRAHVILIIGT